MPLKKHSVRLFVLLLIFLQLGGGPKVHRDDPMNEFVKNGVNMGYGAAAGAAVYLVSKILGSTVGSSDVAKAIRKNLPFMSAIIPRKGWIGWREEVLDLLGMTTLGASVGSYTAGGQLAQQFQFGFSDAVSHYFLSTVAELVRGDKLFTTQPPFIDVVMVKTATQIIKDVAMPGGAPAFRGRSTGILVLNAATEITLESVIGALEGVSLALIYDKVRGRKNIPLLEFMAREAVIGASARGLQAIATVIYFGPRVHVSKSEKRKIRAYAKARGVDVRWGVKHAQFRDAEYSLYMRTHKNIRAWNYNRHAVLQNDFDVRKDPRNIAVGAHEVYHAQQMAKTPDWIYMRLRYSKFRKKARRERYENRAQERFPLERFPESRF